MNVLISSVGRRVKLVEAFRSELQKVNGRVIAVDCDPTAPALHFADMYEVVPRIDDSSYIDYLKKVCKKYEVTGILSLIDPELSLLANHVEEFEKEGIYVIVSDKQMVETCFDKYSTSQFLSDNGLPCIPTYINIDEVIRDLTVGKLEFPLIIKPRKGSASIGINKVYTLEELLIYKNETAEIVIQPFVNGHEFGVDCYIDIFSRRLVNMFMKKKIVMRAGETDKSISVRDNDLKQLIERLVNVLKPLGPIDIDCFLIKDGFVISEINPRFGGGYLHAHMQGQNFVENIVKNLSGFTNQLQNIEYEEDIIMVKYEDVKLMKNVDKGVRTGQI
jgi:carbamoyl-phosphate synthase large subunit